MSRPESTWHDTQRARLQEGEQKLAFLPVRTQRLLRSELESLAELVEFIEPDTAKQRTGISTTVASEVDTTVAEIVVLADALE